MQLARSYAFSAGRPTPSLNCHFHFHVCVIDGVFSEDPEGSVLFHEATHLTAKDWDQAFRLIRLPPLLSPLGGRAAGYQEVDVTLREGEAQTYLLTEKTATSERWGWPAFSWALVTYNRRTQSHLSLSAWLPAYISRSCS